MCFESSTFMALRNGKIQDKKHLKFPQNILQKMGKRTLPK